MAADGPLPMVVSPRLSRCTAPAPGPPATLISTRPDGSGYTQPSGLPRLITDPSRSGDCARERSAGTSWQLT